MLGLGFPRGMYFHQSNTLFKYTLKSSRKPIGPIRSKESKGDTLLCTTLWLHYRVEYDTDLYGNYPKDD